MARIARRHPAATVDVAQRRRCGGVRAEHGLPFPVCHHDRQPRAGHAAQPHARTVQHLDQRQTRLELLRAVARKVRPVLGAGDQPIEL
jgi:hypothetical protein